MSPPSPLPEPLDPLDPPPLDRYCDLVLEGGVINGVVYPGFLMELARKFRFASIGGTSVGAIAAALAVACEYSRRYGRDTGFNEGLRKLPEELGEFVDPAKQITKIRSLFQPMPQVKKLFDFGVELLGNRVTKKPGVYGDDAAQAPPPAAQPQSRGQAVKECICIFYKHFRTSWLETSFLGLIFLYLAFIFTTYSLFVPFGLFFLLLILHYVFAPISNFIGQLQTLLKMQGFGMCSGKSIDGKQDALIEWLHAGIQKSASLSFAKPLTFNDIWGAPNGPIDATGNNRAHSIEFRAITSCLSHGRIYELPIQDPTARVFFRLSEFKDFFPDDIIRQLRKVAKPIDFETDPLTYAQRYDERASDLKTQLDTATRDKLVDSVKEINKRLYNLPIQKKLLENLLLEKELGAADSIDIRELPAGELPILVAARLSFSVPVLFQSVPLLGFNLDMQPEDMSLARLWFSDGGLGSNLPVTLFDKAFPRWPTFAVKIVEESPKRANSKGVYKSFVPFFHKGGMEDRLIAPTDNSGFTKPDQSLDWRSFVKFVFGLYTTTKDGSDRASLRMPNVRNRVVSIFTNDIVGGALNLMIPPDAIRRLGCSYGVNAGLTLTKAYLAQVTLPRYAQVSAWTDHRWARFNILVNSLRQHVTGFNLAAQSSSGCNALTNQINAAMQKPPLQSLKSNEPVLTAPQADQLKNIVSTIQNLEAQLNQLNRPIPYQPMPDTELRIKPKI